MSTGSWTIVEVPGFGPLRWRKPTDLPIVEFELYEKDALQRYAHGAVRFDGCINYELMGDSPCLLHACGRNGLRALTAALERVYDIAAEVMPEHACTLREP